MIDRALSACSRALLAICYAIMVFVGFCAYRMTGKTPSFAYQSMIRLFCLTRGRSNDWISMLVGTFKRPYRFGRLRGVLGDFSCGDWRDAALRSLRESGYHVFDRKLPTDMCDRLLKFAETQQSEVCKMDGQQSGPTIEEVYTRGSPRAVRYNFKTRDLLGNPDVQTLLADLSLAAIAQDYLGARPVIDVLSMWWLTDFSDAPDAQAAQFFHFDMDRPKWLKFFIYLTDVGPSNGPHSFVAGSHKTDGIPGSLLDKGYSRLSDAEVGAAYDAVTINEIVAPRGTILAEDTRGLHKGKQVLKGDRLMLQVQYSNCLFGGDYPRIGFEGQMVHALRESLREFPGLFAAYFSEFSAH